MPWPYDARDPWTMDEKGRRRWERIRAKGRLHFILVWGVLFWGLGIGIVDVVGSWVWRAPSFRSWPLILTDVIFFGLFGFFWGRWRWRDRELQYQGGAGQ